MSLEFFSQSAHHPTRVLRVVVVVIVALNGVVAHTMLSATKLTYAPLNSLSLSLFRHVLQQLLQLIHIYTLFPCFNRSDTLGGNTSALLSFRR